MVELLAPKSTDRGIKSASKATLVVIGLGFVTHVLLAAFVGLSYDETYVAVMARQPSLGYADHPPLAMWIAHLGTWLTGCESDFAIRLPFMLLFAATTWFVYRLGAFLLDERAGFFGAAALTVTPLIGFYIGTFAVTDGPMLFGWTGAALCIARAIWAERRTQSWLYWCGGGALTGIALLGKFTAILLPAGVLLFLVTAAPYRFWLRHPAPYVAALLGGLFFAPVLVWNAEHGWVALSFQAGRALPDRTLRIGRLLAYIGVPALFLLPWIWVGLIIAWIKALRRGPGDAGSWFLCCLALVPLVVFALIRLVAAGEDNGYHWLAPGYVMLCPLLGSAVITWLDRYPRAIVHMMITTGAVLMLLLAGLAAHAVTGWPPSKRDPILYDLTDWRDLRDYLRQPLPVRDGYFVLGTRWDDCVKIELALPATVPVLCFAKQPLGYAFRDQSSYLGRDAIIVSRNWPQDLARKAYGDLFDSIDSLPPATISAFGHERLRLTVFVARNFHRTFDYAHARY